MKCNALVRWVEKRRAGTGKSYSKPNFWMHADRYNEASENMARFSKSRRGNFPKRDELEICDGNVELLLSISQGCCCHDASELEIRYKCNKCGFTTYPDAPQNIHEIQEFLNQKL